MIIIIFIYSIMPSTQPNPYARHHPTTAADRRERQRGRGQPQNSVPSPNNTPPSPDQTDSSESEPTRLKSRKNKGRAGRKTARHSSHRHTKHRRTKHKRRKRTKRKRTKRKTTKRKRTKRKGKRKTTRRVQRGAGKEARGPGAGAGAGFTATAGAGGRLTDTTTRTTPSQQRAGKQALSARLASDFEGIIPTELTDTKGQIISRREASKRRVANERGMGGPGGQFAGVKTAIQPEPLPPYNMTRREADGDRYWAAWRLARDPNNPQNLPPARRGDGRPVINPRNPMQIAPPPISPAQQVANARHLGGLQTVAAKKKEEEAAKWDDDCTICLEKMGSSSHGPPLKFPCTHIFCTNCIDRWLTTTRGCPICRREINLIDGKQQDEGGAPSTAVGAGGGGLGGRGGAFAVDIARSGPPSLSPSDAAYAQWAQDNPGLAASSASGYSSN
jgi:hypothetical protein